MTIDSLVGSLARSWQRLLLALGGLADSLNTLGTPAGVTHQWVSRPARLGLESSQFAAIDGCCLGGVTRCPLLAELTPPCRTSPSLPDPCYASRPPRTGPCSSCCRALPALQPRSIAVIRQGVQGWTGTALLGCIFAGSPTLRSGVDRTPLCASAALCRRARKGTVNHESSSSCAGC